MRQRNLGLLANLHAQMALYFAQADFEHTHTGLEGIVVGYADASHGLIARLGSELVAALRN